FTHYTVEELKPLQCTYHGYTIISAPPPSSGGITLCEILNILEYYPLAKWGFHSTASIHYIIEAMRFAFADRNFNLGDPDYVQNPTEHLIAKKYAATIRLKIQNNRATPATTIVKKLPATCAETQSIHTTHYSIIDKWGNAVSLTYTLNGNF